MIKIRPRRLQKNYIKNKVNTNVLPSNGYLCTKAVMLGHRTTLTNTAGGPNVVVYSAAAVAYVAAGYRAFLKEMEVEQCA